MPDSNAVFGKRNAQEHSARAECTPDAYSAITQAARAAFSQKAGATEDETDTPRLFGADREEADLKLYFGAEWPRYAPLWRRMESGGWKPSWSFAAAFLAGYWLLYRKQNVGLAFVAAYFLLGVVGSSLEVYAIAINVACVVFLGLFGKSMVINGALETIARIRAAHAGRHGDLRIGIAGDPSWLLPLMALLLVINISFSIEPQTHVENVAMPSVEESH
jgi:hypothetical protein